uniref:Exonuclease 1 n=1 Tax=Macrostomum lignano TaxID=282301 RepID=A0A1I8JEL4_9PLAT
MGITGLLPYLKASGRPISIRELAGQTVAVDTYCWLHKGAYACAEKLGSGQDTDQYVHYCMRYLRLLLANRLKVVLVFDGRNLPAKADLLAEGRSAEAREAFERCIDVTPSMALALMRSARKEGADTIVAPYEADAQLTHLCNAGLVDAVISEDSDLLAFGCKRVIFKLDSQGNGLLMDRRQIARQLCIPASADDPNSAEATGSTGMTWAKFRWMCILSGCDYFSGVPGVGLATAAGIVKRTCLDLRGLANKLFLYAKKVQRLSKEQVEAVVRADLTFQYQVVFDPIQRRQCRLNTPPSAAESEAEAPSNLDFAGSILSDNALALQLAHGNVDFRTMEPVADFDPADIGTPNNNKNIPTTNSSKNSSSIIWAGDGSKLDRRIASEASIVGAGNSPYFSSISGSGSAISASLWRTDSTNSIGIGATSSSAAGVGSTERLCRLYSSLSSDSLLAAEVATVAETDEKENSETSARLDDEIPANQAWPADVVEIADLTPSDAPATSGSQQQLRQPEFRQIECKCLRRTSPEKKPSTTDKIIDISSRRQHFRWNWKYTGLQIGKKDDVNKKDSKQPRHDAMKRLFRLSNDRNGTEIRPQRHDAMKRLSRLSNDRSGTEIRPQRHDAMKRLSRLSNDRSGTEIRPQRHDAMKRLSRLSNDRSGTEISYIDEALEMEPNNHVLLSNRCAARLKLGEFGLALQDARKCRTLAPDWPKRFDACRGYMVGVAAYNAIIRQPALVGQRCCLSADAGRQPLLLTREIPHYDVVAFLEGPRSGAPVQLLHLLISLSRQFSLSQLLDASPVHDSQFRPIKLEPLPETTTRGSSFFSFPGISTVTLNCPSTLTAIFSAFSRSSSGSDSSLRWIRSSWMPSTSRSLSIDSKLFPNLQSTARRRKLARKSATDSVLARTR